jgi:hypothetical protein
MGSEAVVPWAGGPSPNGLPLRMGDRMGDSRYAGDLVGPAIGRMGQS